MLGCINQRRNQSEPRRTSQGRRSGVARCKAEMRDEYFEEEINSYQIKKLANAISDYIQYIEQDEENYANVLWLEEITGPQNHDEVMKELHNGIECLRKAAVYAQRIGYLLSGDDGPETFLERLKEDL